MKKVLFALLVVGLFVGCGNKEKNVIKRVDVDAAEFTKLLQTPANPFLVKQFKESKDGKVGLVLLKLSRPEEKGGVNWEETTYSIDASKLDSGILEKLKKLPKFDPMPPAGQ